MLQSNWKLVNEFQSFSKIIFNLNLSLTIKFLGNEPLIYITAIKLN